MVPLNLLLAAIPLMIGVDLYQILSAMHGFQGTYHFTVELLKSEFSTVLMGAAAVYGLSKDPQDRVAKWFFLGLLVYDAVFDVVEAFQVDGKTAAQMAEVWKQMPALKVYLLFQMPMFMACLILMTAGISLQMRRPFFIRYASMEKWQSAALLFFALVYYVEAGLLLVLGAGWV